MRQRIRERVKNIIYKGDKTHILSVVTVKATRIVKYFTETNVYHSNQIKYCYCYELFTIYYVLTLMKKQVFIFTDIYKA